MTSALTPPRAALRRLFFTLQRDMRLQFRNGFYYVSAFMVAALALGFSQLRGLDLAWLLPALLLGNLVVNTFYFIGGLVLLEKDEGSLEVQVVTPLRTWEYLAAKVGSLVLLSLLENAALVALIYGLRLNLLALLLGLAAASVIYALVGFIAVARFSSVNEYLFPSLLYALPLSLPLVDYFGLVKTGLIYLHPLQAPLLLLQAAFQPISAWQWAYGLLYTAVWTALLYRLASREFARHIIGRQGK
jgi:fluoroquinolone transport system permease protein